MDSERNSESRCEEINASIRRESRPTRHDVPKVCPTCGVEACFDVQCIRCWKLERDKLMIGWLAED